MTKTDWKPVAFESFDDVPMHYRALKEWDPEVVQVSKNGDLLYFHKASTDQYWIHIGKEDGHCPTERCGAQCCKWGSPWPTIFPHCDRDKPCMFLKDDAGCGIHGSKFVCCMTAPEPWNDMRNLDKCELRCVEVTRG